MSRPFYFSDIPPALSTLSLAGAQCLRHDRAPEGLALRCRQGPQRSFPTRSGTKSLPPPRALDVSNTICSNKKQPLWRTRNRQGLPAGISEDTSRLGSQLEFVGPWPPAASDKLEYVAHALCCRVLYHTAKSWIPYIQTTGADRASNAAHPACDRSHVRENR